MVWYSHLFNNFPRFVVIHIVKGFRIVSEAEVDIFLEFSCFFYDPVDIGASLVAQLVKNLPVMLVGKILWRRERLPTPVFWPGEFHRLYSPWGPKELDMTERTHFHLLFL